MAWSTRLLYYSTTSTKSLIGYSQTDQLDKFKATRLIKKKQKQKRKTKKTLMRFSGKLILKGITNSVVN